MIELNSILLNVTSEILKNSNVSLTLTSSIKVLTTFRYPLSCQFLQQDLGLFEVRGVESLGEPAVDLR
jgi:hypothetical protein